MNRTEFDKYLLAVDQCKNSTQEQIVKSISSAIGSGAVKQCEIKDVISEPWCEFLSIDVKLKTSKVLLEQVEWKCSNGFEESSMKMLNDEFNYFRGLFPLKVFITGPPCSGKTFFASQLSEQYGIPHLRIKDIIDYALSLDNDFGKQLKVKIEELKDQAEADYEKSRKKKDPDFDRESYNPRLTDDILADLVKFQLGSAACMNKGFILDGFPRSKEDAQLVFTNEVPIEKPEKEGDEDPEGAGEEEPQTKREINEKILPQYCIAFEADDAFLSQRAKDIPPEQVEGTHFNDAGMVRRLKEYRTRNPDDSGNTVKDFITETIGYPNVLVVDSSIPNNEQLTKMQEIIE